MITDRRIQEAIEAGERNLATAELIYNWCAHARIEKFGGVGLIEQQTGLPIGHHGLRCDYATAARNFTYDLREAALDFHDRHCVDCKMRKPKGFPNLSVLVKERDERRAKQAADQATTQASAALALSARKKARSILREKLPAVSSSILDDIEEYDANRRPDERDRICESARLAPEHFAPLSDYLFELTANDWFAEVGLTVLHRIGADPKRLSALALGLILHPPATRAAAAILLDHTSHIDAALIPQALPAIIDLALPDDEPFLQRQRSGEAELLRRLWAAYPAAIQQGLDELFSTRSRYRVELGGRGVVTLLADDARAATVHLRAMVSKFSRARLLIDDFDEDFRDFRYLREAIATAFKNAPDEADVIIQNLINGSDRHSRMRAFTLYSAVMRHKSSDKLVPEDSQVHRVAFRRLMWAATTESDDEILRSVQDVFRGRPYGFLLIARAELDNLLGALLILDDRLRKHDDEPPRDEKDNFLAVLERQNRRSAITGLMKSFVEWAAAAAAQDISLARKIADTLAAVPDDRHDLKGILLGAIEHLADTVEGLKLFLPHLYYGLVGPSALVRAYAADALSELPHTARQNVPPLVYEAFSVLLWDQYVVVHRAAVHALGRFRLPDEYRGRMAQALLNLVHYYSKKPDTDDFLVECVERLAFELDRVGKAQSDLGKYLVQVLLKAKPLYVQSKLRFLARPLGKTEGFVDLLIRILPELSDYNDAYDDEWMLLSRMPASAVLPRKTAFEALGKELAPLRPWQAFHVIETLCRSGAYGEARRIAEAVAKDSVPTVRNRSLRIQWQFFVIAIALEDAITESRPEEIPNLIEQWEKNLAAQREHEADAKARDSRSSFPSSL